MLDSRFPRTRCRCRRLPPLLPVCGLAAAGVRLSLVRPHRCAPASQNAQHLQHLFNQAVLRLSPHAEGAETDPLPGTPMRAGSASVGFPGAPLPGGAFPSNDHFTSMSVYRHFTILPICSDICLTVAQLLLTLLLLPLPVSWLIYFLIFFG